MQEFPDFFELPLEKWIDRGVNWLTVEGDAFFDAIGGGLLQLLLWLEGALLWIPWYVLIAAVALVAWRVKDWRLAAGSAVGMVFIGLLGLWEASMQTLAIVLAATLLAIVVGVPIGIAMTRKDWIESLIRPILDMMQTLPSFVYLIPALMLFGLGKVPALIATFIYAVPLSIRFTNLGIRQVPADVIEAAEAFGATQQQQLFKVQLPLALPTIMAGINQTIMMALAMVVVASMIGAGGLGSEVLNGISRLEVGRGFVAGISIVILAIIMDRITQNMAPARAKAVE
ncbi:MAG: proline/glycine betaine ABC transporter permease [Chloroflexota bacterium]|nr:proline/glycine betaine ABC transporter permease [Chloroflexota bacterium]